MVAHRVHDDSHLPCDLLNISVKHVHFAAETPGPRRTAAKYSNAFGIDRESMPSNAAIRAQASLVESGKPRVRLEGVRGSSPLNATEITGGQGPFTIGG